MNAEKTAGNIARWLRDYVANYSKDGYVVGLSGGVDSAVAAALAVRGVGRGRVGVILMPCHSSSEDARLGGHVAQWLGVMVRQIDLSCAYDAQIAALPVPETGPVEIMARLRLAEANVKPRLRMITLYYLSTSLNCLVLGTSNLSERMLGYFTKYGDGGVDVEPLGQLYKTEVWELAEHLGVPQKIIDRAPSAGLWPGQTDEGEIGFPYADIDAYLQHRDTVAYPNCPLAARIDVLREAAQHKLHMPPLGPGAVL